MKNLVQIVREFTGLAGRLRRDERGVSAVEFAMLLPLMLTMYLGTVEVSQGIGASRKLSLTTRAVADLVSQMSSINNADMTNSLNAAATVMAPYSTSNLKVVVSSVTIDSTGKATVAWSEQLNSAVRATGSTITLPTALNVPNTSLIFSEVQYNYTPTIGYIISGTISLKDQIYMRPRLSDKVTRVNS